MRKLIIILLTTNLVTFAWLVVGAKTEFPPWEESFQNTKSIFADLERADPEVQAVMINVARAHINATEAWTKIVMNEYRRSDTPLSVLTICNIVGLAILALRERNSNKQRSQATDVPPVRDL